MNQLNHYTQTAQNYFHVAKSYVIAYRNEFTIGGAVVLGAAILLALYVYNDPNKIVYQPAKACSMLTPNKAEDLLGDKVYSTDANKPVVSGDVATSKCGYTDENNDTSAMKLAAIAVRSGVNDAGIKQNRSEFAAAGKLASNAQIVKDLGNSAYFNPTNGQLNVLDGRNWIILNFGVATTPEANTLDDAIKLAHKVLS
ncbi:MAG TPA: hypothetical protein VMT96_00195 [Candidatus Bathyarchaeia archaeon]|nr:hypothetical protein [Candidatus Bathyarchaeia archaeon]